MRSDNQQYINPDLDRILHDIKTRLGSFYDERLDDVILYGSFARGEQREGSDIDIAVVLKGSFDKYEEVERIVDITYEISLEHDILISVLPLTVDEYQNGTYPIFNNIRREGVVV